MFYFFNEKSRKIGKSIADSKNEQTYPGLFCCETIYTVKLFKKVVSGNEIYVDLESNVYDYFSLAKIGLYTRRVVSYYKIVLDSQKEPPIKYVSASESGESKEGVNISYVNSICPNIYKNTC